MVSQLPTPLKHEVLYYLQKGDFQKAKDLHDSWLESQPCIYAESMADSDSVN